LCRGHGLSLLAPARGTPALPAKGDFSRWSSKPLTVGSQDSCCSRRSRRLTLQPFELDSKKRLFMNLFVKHSDFLFLNPIMKLTRLNASLGIDFFYYPLFIILFVKT